MPNKEKKDVLLQMAKAGKRMGELPVIVNSKWAAGMDEDIEYGTGDEPMDMTTINMLSEKLVELLGEPFEECED